MAKGKSGAKGLKNALQSQQQRLKKKEQAKHAAQAAEQWGKKPPQAAAKGKGKGPAPARGVTIPFKATDRILLVGEGNFSFARALVQHTAPAAATDAPPASLAFLPPSSITATAYDPEDECYGKYPDARAIVRLLREKGVEVLFGVDATRLEKHPALKGRRWDRVVWNFPHAGKGITDQDRNILTNQLLVLGFLRAAQHVLALGPVPIVTSKRKPKKGEDDDDDEEEAAEVDEPEDDPTAQTSTRGTVLITLRNVPPYTLWNVPKLAKSPPAPTSVHAAQNPRYKQLRSFAFDRSSWAGYAHRMTKGERAGGAGTTGVGGEDRTWEFCLAD